MPVKCEFESGNLGVYTASEKIGQAEYVEAQQVAEAAIQKFRTIKMLIVLENFAGWERTEGWEDLSFPERNNPYIEKIAIVGDPQWQDLCTRLPSRDCVLFLLNISIRVRNPGRDSGWTESYRTNLSR